MRRRDFIAFLGGAVVWPLAARAQQSSSIRRIAWMGIGRPDTPSLYVESLRAGLRDLGWVEGRNLTIDLYWAQRDDMDAVARDLVASKPEIIVTQELMVFAVNRLKPPIPIVFGFSGDPVDAKLVQSIANPGGNLTGMSYLALELVGKRIELLKEWLPQIRRVAILARPQHPGEQREREASEEVVRKLGIELSYHPIPFVPRTDLPRLHKILSEAVENRCDALIVFPDAGMFDVSDHIASFALQAKLPSVSGWAPFARNGLLLSYGPNLRELYRSLSSYVDRILRGTQPANLPVELPTKIELVINAKTATAIGVVVPPMLLARADEVIE
jgi:putative ABC transport system substrate-binding protein